MNLLTERVAPRVARLEGLEFERLASGARQSGVQQRNSPRCSDTPEKFALMACTLKMW